MRKFYYSHPIYKGGKNNNGESIFISLIWYDVVQHFLLLINS